MSVGIEADYLQAMKHFDGALRLFSYMRESRGTKPDQALLDSLRLVYKRAGQAGKSLVDKLGEDFTEQN